MFVLTQKHSLKITNFYILLSLVFMEVRLLHSRLLLVPFPFSWVERDVVGEGSKPGRISQCEYLFFFFIFFFSFLSIPTL